MLVYNDVDVAAMMFCAEQNAKMAVVESAGSWFKNILFLLTEQRLGYKNVNKGANSIRKQKKLTITENKLKRFCIIAVGSFVAKN